jgi:hypothetical protein
MLAEEQEVGGELAGQAVVCQTALEGEGVAVGDGAEVEDGKREGVQGSGFRVQE